MIKNVFLSFFILSFSFFAGAQKFTNSIVTADVVFEEVDGIVAVEAEFFYQQTKNEIRQWYRTSKNEIPTAGRDEDGPHCKNAGNNAYVEILPDTRVTSNDKLIAGENFSNKAGEMGLLHYKLKINTPGRYYVWARIYSSGAEDNGLHVGLDGEWPESGQRLQWCEGKKTWRWDSKQRTEKVHCGEPYLIYLDIEKPGIHEITFSMREDGVEFDRFLLTNKKDYIPTGIGPDVKLAAGKIPETYPVVESDPEAKTSFLFAVEKSIPGVKLIRATSFPVDGTNYYLNDNWLAINPKQHKKASTTTNYNAKDGECDLLLLGVGENDGNSTYEVKVNNSIVGTSQSPPSKYSFEEGAKFIGLFKNVNLKKGDKISVSSEIASNDGKEFSRARWSGIALVSPGKGEELIGALAEIGTQQNVGNNVPKVSESANVVVEQSGELKKWHKITFTFNGPETSENDEFNPFMNYRFNVLFTHEQTGKSFLVPGYFAADGKAGESSSVAGNKWRVHFTPNQTGTWNYKVDFRKGNWLAVSERKNAGESAGFMDGAEGVFSISENNKTEPDNRAKGMLLYDGTRYLKYAETSKPMLKVGPDAPENFLAYVDFDGTFQTDGHKDNLVKTWEAHLKDWKNGDPSWKDGKGKAMIGALNYLASKGMNVFSFLTMNIVGDDQNVFPYIDYDTYDRFDCSKLDQWEIVFEHADKLGMFLHFKTMESENQGLLDNGAIGAKTKLYYRELMARFGHHLALNWNIGEEMGDWVKNHPTPPLFTTQRLAAAEYFYQNDPYHHHVVIHNGVPFDDILGTESKYTGVSLQTNKVDFSRVHEATLLWLKKSKEAGKQWAVAVDEPGDAQHSLLPDSEDPAHDNARINGLWGAFMAGAWGTEWYFGYQHEHSDLTCQDYRSRDLFWDQCRHLVDFFESNNIPICSTENRDDLVDNGDYCLAVNGEMYMVFLRKGKGNLNLENVSGNFDVNWFDPRNGGKLQKGKPAKISAGKVIELSGAPSNSEKDWVVLLNKI